MTDQHLKETPLIS